MVATTLPAVVRVVDLPTGTTITGAELLEVVQTASGVGQSIQVPISQIMTTSLGGLPIGGATGQLLAKTSGTNFATNFSSIISFVAVGTSLATTGSATSIVAFVPNQGISSTQIANNAVGTNQVASSLGIASSLSIGGLITVGGTATVTGTTILNGGLQVVGTSQFTGSFNVVGTSIHTGVFVLASQATGVLVSSGTGVVSAQGGMVLLNTLSPNNVASTNDTTSFSSAYRSYLFVMDNIAPANNTVFLQMQVATSGANFISGGYVAHTVVAGLLDTFSTTVFILSGNTATTSVSSSLLYGVSGHVYLHNPAGSVARKSIEGLCTYMIASASLSTSSLGFGQISGIFDGTSSPVTGVNFSFSAGNIQTGTIKIYGIT